MQMRVEDGAKTARWGNLKVLYTELIDAVNGASIQSLLVATAQARALGATRWPEYAVAEDRLRALQGLQEELHAAADSPDITRLERALADARALRADPESAHSAEPWPAYVIAEQRLQTLLRLRTELTVASRGVLMQRLACALRSADDLGVSTWLQVADAEVRLRQLQRLLARLCDAAGGCSPEELVATLNFAREWGVSDLTEPPLGPAYVAVLRRFQAMHLSNISEGDALEKLQDRLLELEDAMVPMEQVEFTLAIRNVDYGRLSADARLLASFEETMKQEIASQAGPLVCPADVHILELSAGSVVARCAIRAVEDISSVKDAVGSGAAILNTLPFRLETLEGFDAVCVGPVSVQMVSPPVVSASEPAEVAPAGPVAQRKRSLAPLAGGTDRLAALAKFGSLSGEAPLDVEAAAERGRLSALAILEPKLRMVRRKVRALESLQAQISEEAALRLRTGSLLAAVAESTDVATLRSAVVQVDEAVVSAVAAGVLGEVNADEEWPLLGKVRGRLATLAATEVELLLLARRDGTPPSREAFLATLARADALGGQSWAARVCAQERLDEVTALEASILDALAAGEGVQLASAADRAAAAGLAQWPLVLLASRLAGMFAGTGEERERATALGARHVLETAARRARATQAPLPEALHVGLVLKVGSADELQGGCDGALWQHIEAGLQQALGIEVKVVRIVEAAPGQAVADVVLAGAGPADLQCCYADLYWGLAGSRSDMLPTKWGPLVDHVRCGVRIAHSHMVNIPNLAQDPPAIVRVSPSEMEGAARGPLQMDGVVQELWTRAALEDVSHGGTECGYATTRCSSPSHGESLVGRILAGVSSEPLSRSIASVHGEGDEGILSPKTGLSVIITGPGGTAVGDGLLSIPFAAYVSPNPSQAQTVVQDDENEIEEDATAALAREMVPVADGTATENFSVTMTTDRTAAAKGPAASAEPGAELLTAVRNCAGSPTSECVSVGVTGASAGAERNAESLVWRATTDATGALRTVDHVAVADSAAVENMSSIMTSDRPGAAEAHSAGAAPGGQLLTAVRIYAGSPTSECVSVGVSGGSVGTERNVESLIWRATADATNALRTLDRVVVADSATIENLSATMTSDRTAAADAIAAGAAPGAQLLTAVRNCPGSLTSECVSGGVTAASAGTERNVESLAWRATAEVTDALRTLDLVAVADSTAIENLSATASSDRTAAAEAPSAGAVPGAPLLAAVRNCPGSLTSDCLSVGVTGASAGTERNVESLAWRATAEATDALRTLDLVAVADSTAIENLSATATSDRTAAAEAPPAGVAPGAPLLTAVQNCPGSLTSECVSVGVTGASASTERNVESLVWRATAETTDALRTLDRVAVADSSAVENLSSTMTSDRVVAAEAAAAGAAPGVQLLPVVRNCAGSAASDCVSVGVTGASAGTERNADSLVWRATAEATDALRTMDLVAVRLNAASPVTDCATVALTNCSSMRVDSLVENAVARAGGDAVRTAKEAKADRHEHDEHHHHHSAEALRRKAGHSLLKALEHGQLPIALQRLVSGHTCQLHDKNVHVPRTKAQELRQRALGDLAQALAEGSLDERLEFLAACASSSPAKRDVREQTQATLPSAPSAPTHCESATATGSPLDSLASHVVAVAVSASSPP